MAKLVILVAIANGTPVIATKLFGTHLAFPADGGHVFMDRRAIFGSSKTWRGILLSVLATVLGAFLIGLEWKTGVLVSTTAMAGDLLSSFIKRRLGHTPSSMAIGLDQIPESLFPLAACKLILPITATEVVIGTLVFLAGGLVISRILFKLHVRDRPY